MLNFAKAILSSFEESMGELGMTYESLLTTVVIVSHAGLMIGQISYHTLKNFPKLAGFPLPAPPCRSNLGRGIEDDTCTYL